jgi:transposase
VRLRAQERESLQTVMRSTRSPAGWARRAQMLLHFAPTYSSWLNQVKIWLGIITRDCLRHGIFRSVPDLVNHILRYVQHYNRNAQPFRWTYRNPKSRIHISVTRH